MSELHGPQPRAPSAAPLPVDLPAHTPRHRLQGIHQAAVDFFQKQLNRSIRDYLAGRDLSADQIDRWAIGYAPRSSSRTALLNFLTRERGYSVEEVVHAGLAKTDTQERAFDLFTARVMFPVRDEYGYVIAFNGRASNEAHPKAPKYLNSPSTGLFTKSAVLFGMAEAIPKLRAGAQPVLVEGAFDVVAIDTHPDFAGVAPCGTALTDHQVQTLARHTRLEAVGAIGAFDTDAAGLKAMKTAYTKLAPFTKELYHMRIPAGCDPAEMYERGGLKAISEALQKPDPLLDLLIDTMIDAFEQEHRLGGLDTVEGQVQVVRETVAFMAEHCDAPEAARQFSRISERMNRATSIAPIPHGFVADEFLNAIIARRPADTTRKTAPHHMAPRPQARSPQDRPTAPRPPDPARSSATQESSLAALSFVPSHQQPSDGRLSAAPSTQPPPAPSRLGASTGPGR